MKRKISRHTILVCSAIISAIIALSFIVLAMMLSYKQTKESVSQQLNQSNNYYQFKITSLINQVDHSLAQINITKTTEPCSKDLVKQLQAIVFYNPLISAVVISNLKGQLLCTNIEEITGNPVILPKNFFLHEHNFNGPVNLANFNQQAFYYTVVKNGIAISALMLPKAFEQVMPDPPKPNQSIILYSLNQQHNQLVFGKPVLFKFKDKHLSGENQLSFVTVSSNNVDYLIHAKLLTPFNQNYLLAAIPLSTVWQQLKANNIVIGGISLLLAIVVIFLIQYSTHKHLSLDKELKRAVKREEFIPYYQPVIDLNTKRCSGVEVLIRWRTNPDEIIMPDYFIATAERSGLILPMTDHLINRAIHDCKPLLQQDENFHLAINLSTIHFQNDLLFKRIHQKITQLDINPKQLIFELTERYLIDTANHVVKDVMQSLRQLGFKLAIDDFGTGYSSLTYLKHFEFDYLKIDKLFISAIGTGAITENLNSSIITMANSMNYGVIAEGIETQTQYNYLREKGVKLGQGWLFSKPLPIDKFIEYYNNQNKQHAHKQDD